MLTNEIEFLRIAGRVYGPAHGLLKRFQFDRTAVSNIIPNRFGDPRRVLVNGAKHGHKSGAVRSKFFGVWRRFDCFSHCRERFYTG